jgi:hypothetical protein
MEEAFLARRLPSEGVRDLLTLALLASRLVKSIDGSGDLGLSLAGGEARLREAAVSAIVGDFRSAEMFSAVDGDVISGAAGPV